SLVQRGMIRSGLGIVLFLLSWPLLVAAHEASGFPWFAPVNHSVPGIDRLDPQTANLSVREAPPSLVEVERSHKHGTNLRDHSVAVGRSAPVANLHPIHRYVAPSAPHCEWLPYDATAPPART